MFPKFLIHERVFPQILDLPWQLDRVLESVLGPGATIREDRWSPAVDVRETDEALIIVAELPGVMQADVKVTVVDGALTIRAPKKEAAKPRRIAIEVN